MKTVRVLSVISLAAFLILQGLMYIAELTTPVLFSLIGILGLVSGSLMFISLSHWINLRKEK